MVKLRSKDEFYGIELIFNEIVNVVGIEKRIWDLKRKVVFYCLRWSWLVKMGIVC